MAGVLPNRFLFRYSFPVRYDEAALPPLETGENAVRDPWPFGLKGDFDLPATDSLDDAKPFGRIALVWNEQGLGVAAEVIGKSAPPDSNATTPDETDGLQVWFDTRNTQSIHRASRFCHHFCLLPSGSGTTGKSPIGIQLPIARSREETPLTDPRAIPIAAEVFETGYRLEAWFSAETLHGFDPEANPRIGFYYALRDAELGEQYLTVGHEFPFERDPSVWSTLELVR